MPGSVLTNTTRSNRRLGQYTGEVFALPTLLGSRTNGRNSHAEDDAIIKFKGPEKKPKGSVPSQKGCVWDAARNEKSICKGQDLLKHIHHIKVNNESEKGLSLTEVCRISMRTREFLAESLQWLDSAMAQLQLGANASGRVTRQEFVEILNPFTEGVLSLQERHLLFMRLDGENKGYVNLELTESEHKKYEELKRKSSGKAAQRVSEMNHAPSAMRSQQPSQPADALGSQNIRMDLIEEQSAVEVPNNQAHEDQVVASSVPEAHKDQEGSSNAEPPKESEVSASPVDFTASPEAMFADDAELMELEGRLQELRSMQAERVRRRRKRELEAEIAALQRELEAKTPKARSPHAAESSCSSTSKVSFALPSTLGEC
eukprot:gnl/MRDRNA2_/MRDRNA2_60715_c0_seq1.p1 gnl/MRDRNA2_/MRDRNA2_60715_c0~~gnl/MRDRNA2_/MRDRNA2_60715_c0_seq1.p1  ORF type:complete len:373 (-),score=94.29 gnl/MRDRNA2_/MRDRNA2_60715_c0_seq1:205-1323(-)